MEVAPGRSAIVLTVAGARDSVPFTQMLATSGATESAISTFLGQAVTKQQHAITGLLQIHAALIGRCGIYPQGRVWRQRQVGRWRMKSGFV